MAEEDRILRTVKLRDAVVRRERDAVYVASSSMRRVYEFTVAQWAAA